DATGSRSALEALARAYRRGGDRPNLQRTYERLGQSATVDARRGAVYFAVAGALALEAAEQEQAEHDFAEAAQRDGDDLLVHAGRVVLYRRNGKFGELASALKSLIGLVKSKEAQARLHRQLARVAAEHL